MIDRVLGSVQERALRRAGFRHRHIQVSVGRVHALVADGGGSLPSLLVLHGIGTRASSFHRLLAPARAHFRRVIAPDLLGHGRSTDPEEPLGRRNLEAALVEALDVLLDEPTIVLGSSMGGIAAIRYALTRPERVRALFLSSPGGAGTSDPPLDTILDRFRIQGDTGRARALAADLFADPPWYLPLAAYGVRASLGRAALQDFLDGASEADLVRPEELDRLTMPIALSWGRREKLLPPTHRDFYREHLPDHTVFHEPDTGHVPHLEHPDVLLELLLDFARGV